MITHLKSWMANTVKNLKLIKFQTRNVEFLIYLCPKTLRGIDAPESKMGYGPKAKEELANIVRGKCLRALVFDEDRYGLFVADVYCDGIFAQESMLKKGLASHYKAYDQRPELDKIKMKKRWKKRNKLNFGDGRIQSPAEL